MNKLFFLFLFLLIIPFAYSDNYNETVCDSDLIIINDTFEYSDSFELHGWNHVNVACGGNGTPITPSIYGGGGYFGTNGSTAGCTQYPSYTYLNLSTNMNATNSTYFLMEWDGWIYNDTDPRAKNVIVGMFAANDHQIGYTSKYLYNGLVLEFLRDAIDNASSVMARSFNDMEQAIVTYPNSGWRKAHFKWVSNFETGLISVYEDGVVMLDMVQGNLHLAPLTMIDIAYVNFAGNNVYGGIDNFLACGATLSNETTTQPPDCDFPLLFCDEFNYGESLNDHDWIMFNQDSSINTVFSPVNNEVKWNGTEPKALSHEIERFPVTYRTSASETTIFSLYAPVFSNEFSIKISNESGKANLIDFKVFDIEDDLCWILRINGSQDQTDVNVFNMTLNDFQPFVLDIDTALTYDIKAITQFTHINKTGYRFNTSKGYSTVQFRFGSNSVDMPVYSACDSVFYPSIVKTDEESNLTIDDYFMYVGTDTLTDTTDFFIIPLYIPPENTSFVEETVGGVTDFSENIDDLWNTFGLFSATSKAIAALLIMMAVGLVLLATMLKVASGHLAAAAFVVVFGELMLMIFFVYIKLLPLWIPIVLGFLALGVTVFVGKIILSD